MGTPLAQGERVLAMTIPVDSGEVGVFSAGDRVDFRGQKDWEIDEGTVIDPAPNADGRIYVRWHRSGAKTWAKLDCLRKTHNPSDATIISPEEVEYFAHNAEGQGWVGCANVLRALRSALTASGKDAARYQFLRDGEYPLETLDVLIAANVHKTKVDSVIDEAMEKANG